MTYYSMNNINFNGLEIDFYCYEKIDRMNLNDDLMLDNNIYFNPTEHDGINVYKETKTTHLINMMKYYINNDVGTPDTKLSNVCKCGLVHKVKLIYSERCG